MLTVDLHFRTSRKSLIELLTNVQCMATKAPPLKIKIIFLGFLGVFIVIINVVPIQLHQLHHLHHKHEIVTNVGAPGGAPTVGDLTVGE